MNTHLNIRGLLYAIAILVPTLLSPDLVPFIPPSVLPYIKAAAALAVVIKGYLDPAATDAKRDKEGPVE